MLTAEDAAHRRTAALWRGRPGVACFLAAHLQAGLGTGAGYVALLLVAYERIGSAWAATAILLADLLPAMALGPLLGGIVDRTDRLRCAIAADVMRAVAFAGLVVLDGTAAMIALTLAAGTGTALFRPATSALLPAIARGGQLPALNAAYDAVRHTGHLLGPACAGALLLVAAPSAVLAVNAVTFAVSALLLLPLRRELAPREHRAAPGASLIADTGAGLRTALADPVVRTLLATSGAVILAAGMMNVAELVLAQRELQAGGTGFALLLSAYGVGLVAGSLRGGRDADEPALRGRYLASLALFGAGLLGSAAATTLPLAMLSFAATGAANGLFVVTDRLLLQRAVAERLHGGVFGLRDSVEAWSFGAAVVLGGAIATTAGGRVTFAVAGAGALAVLAVATRVLAPTFRPALIR